MPWASAREGSTPSPGTSIRRRRSADSFLRNRAAKLGGKGHRPVAVAVHQQADEALPTITPSAKAHCFAAWSGVADADADEQRQVGQRPKGATTSPAVAASATGRR